MEKYMGAIKIGGVALASMCKIYSLNLEFSWNLHSSKSLQSTNGCCNRWITIFQAVAFDYIRGLKNGIYPLLHPLLSLFVGSLIRLPW